MKKTIIKRNVIQCKYCGDIIESKSVHDFQTCKCGKVSVDGGHEYLKRSSPDPPNDYIELSETQVINYSPCEECAYYDIENEFLHEAECQLLDHSVYGLDAACKYFVES